MTLKAFLLSAAVIIPGITVLPASAAPILFELSGSKNATFTIDSAAIPAFESSSAFGDQISYNSVAGTYGGTAGTATIGFGTNIFAQLNVGGTPLGFTQFACPNLFSLVNSQPVFNLGTYSLTSIVSGSSTLRISSVAAAVPEPATWAMMLVGFGGIGVAMRRRRAVTATIFFA